MQKIITNYLNQIATSDSLFIDGDWGVGKTHYVKTNVISEAIKKNKKPVVFISLNGVSSNDELKSLILAKSIIGDDQNSSKSISKTLKTKASSLLAKTGMGQFLLPSFNITDFLEIKDAIFVFDDLERINSNYSISNVLAIINSELIENHGFKVIIIGNSKKINKQSEFNISKEKIIGWTIKFKSNFDLSVPSILAELKTIDITFHSLIKKEQDFILNMIKYLDLYNLRSIKRSLDYLRIITRSSKITKSTIREIIYFTFILTNEVRNGNIGTEVEVSELPSFITYDLSKLNVNKDNKDVSLTHTSYGRYVANRFLLNDKNNTSYKFFSSIYNLIQSGDFNQIQFDQEIADLKKSKENKAKRPETLLIEKMEGYYFLSNSQFESTKKKVIKLIKNGEFNFYEYIRISKHLIRIKKSNSFLLNEFDINKLLIDNFDKIELKTLGRNYYNNDIQRIIGNKKDFPDKLYKKFYQKLEHVITQNSIKKTDDLMIEIENKHFDNNYIHKVISEVDELDIAMKLISNIENRVFLNSFLANLANRYGSSNAGDFYLQEAKKLSKIISCIRKIIKTKEFESIDKLWTQEILKSIKAVVSHIRSTKMKK